MPFNPHIARASRARKDSAARAHAQKNRFKRAPFLQLRDLLDGSYPFRFLPADNDKNPHGYLDYRVHVVPTRYLVDGQDPGNVKMLCPRSSNWDPLPQNFGAFELDLEYRERCLCCEIDQWLSNSEAIEQVKLAAHEGKYATDEDYYAALEAVSDTAPFHSLPNHLKEVVSALHWEFSEWDSNCFFPVLIKAAVRNEVKKVSASGKEYVDKDYGPAVEPMLALLKIPHDRTVCKTLINYIQQKPDLGDIQTGHWFTLTKSNGGKGSGGYVVMLDPNPTSIDPKLVDYKMFSAFPKWGEPSQKKQGIRLGFPAQLAVIENAEWANELRQYVPFTDEEAATFVPLGETDARMIHKSAMTSPGTQTPITDFARNPVGSAHILPPDPGGARLTDQQWWQEFLMRVHQQDMAIYQYLYYCRLRGRSFQAINIEGNSAHLPTLESRKFLLETIASSIEGAALRINFSPEIGADDIPL